MAKDTFKTKDAHGVPQPDVRQYGNVVVVNMSEMMPLFNVTEKTSAFAAYYPPTVDIRFSSTAKFIDVYTASPHAPPSALMPPWNESEEFVNFVGTVCGKNCFVHANMQKEVVPIWTVRKKSYNKLTDRLRLSCPALVEWIASTMQLELCGDARTEEIYKLDMTA